MTSLTDWIELQGLTQQSLRYRYDVLSPALTVIGTAEVSEDTTPTINNDTANAIKRTLDLRLRPDTFADLDPFSDRIRPAVIFPTGDEYSLGVFLFAANTDNPHGDAPTEHTDTLVDQTRVFEDPSDRTYGVSIGTPIVDAITAVFSIRGVTAYTIDIDAAATVEADLVWPVGTSWLQIVNDLAALAGSFDLYYDNNGLATIRTAPVVDLAEVVYSSVRPRVIQGSEIRSTVPLDAPNRYVVVDSSATDAPVVGIYDVPDSAPHSYASRGYRVTVVKTVQGSGSAGAAAATARAWAKTRQNYETASFISTLDPRHDTYTTLEYADLLWRETSWTAELSATGLMTHSVKRSYDL